jgi:cytochrome P450
MFYFSQDTLQHPVCIFPFQTIPPSSPLIKVSLTWALIELARSPASQSRLRAELAQLYRSNGGADPTYEQLFSQTALPYLDAVVHEILRLHPPVGETNRIASEDDVIPLAYPVTTRDGILTDRIVVKKGQNVSVPIRFIGRSEKFWGEGAKIFRPERWLELGSDSGFRPDGAEKASGNSLKATELSGHRHLLTFSDGQRTCLGKSFALAEFKVCL